MATYTPHNSNGYTTRDGRPVNVSGPDEDGYLWGEVTNQSGRKVWRLWNARTGHHSPGVGDRYERHTDLADVPAEVVAA